MQGCVWCLFRNTLGRGYNSGTSENDGSLFGLFGGSCVICGGEFIGDAIGQVVASLVLDVGDIGVSGMCILNASSDHHQVWGHESDRHRRFVVDRLYALGGLVRLSREINQSAMGRHRLHVSWLYLVK